MENLVFTQLSVPEIRELFRQELSSFFSNNQQTATQSDNERWFDISELCTYLPDKPAKPTVYGWVHQKAIPCHRRGKKLYFLKSEIDTWLKTGRKKTMAEIAAEAQEFTPTKRK
jgi:excisionase family DNA binding protein